MNNSPIFIHSLFRSGSTYLFNVFRRSGQGFWCYQEPLHEVAFFCRDNPLGLQENHGDEKIKILRHPKLDGAYFLELYEAWPAWQDAISEQIVYDSYFPDPNTEFGVKYWKSLISAAKGRPVFQECRTSGRIGLIKNELKGSHIYLWRNPWDQWWSYKINSYFDTVNQIIINSKLAPAPVKNMMAELDLPRYDNRDISGSFAFYGGRPFTSQQSYLVFYMLWCLAMQQGLAHSDLVLNIDRLSDSDSYQREVGLKLQKMSIKGLDFTDCHIPQGRFSYNDQLFFSSLEARVHSWLLGAGWNPNDVKTIQTLRKQFEPASWSIPVAKANPLDLAEHADRYKDLFRSIETLMAERERVALSKINEGIAKIKQYESDSQQAEAREGQSQVHLKQALETVQQTQEVMQEALSRAQAQEARAISAEARAGEQESRAISAEARALAQEERALAAELWGQSEQERVVNAEVRAQVQEDRALAAEVRITEQENLAIAAEARAQAQEARAISAEARAEEQESRAIAAEKHASEADEEKLTLQKLVEALRVELEQVHHANHNHWLQLEDARRELNDVHHANHSHWLLSEARQSQILQMTHSRSWRVTAPIRRIGQGIRNINNLFNATFGLTALIRRAAAFVYRHPKIKKTTLSLLRHSPRLKIRIRNMVYFESVEVVNVKADSVQQPFDYLTAHACSIYKDLENIIDQNRSGD